MICIYMLLIEKPEENYKIFDKNPNSPEKASPLVSALILYVSVKKEHKLKPYM